MSLCFGGVGCFLLPISALEYEKYYPISTLFCIQYSDGAQEYFVGIIWLDKIIWKYNWEKKFNSYSVYSAKSESDVFFSLGLSAVWRDYSCFRYYFSCEFPVISYSVSSELNVADHLLFWESINFCSWESECLFRYWLWCILEIPRFECLLSIKDQLIIFSPIWLPVGIT